MTEQEKFTVENSRYRNGEKPVAIEYGENLPFRATFASRAKSGVRFLHHINSHDPLFGFVRTLGHCTDEWDLICTPAPPPPRDWSKPEDVDPADIVIRRKGNTSSRGVSVCHVTGDGLSVMGTSGTQSIVLVFINYRDIANYEYRRIGEREWLECKTVSTGDKS